MIDKIHIVLGKLKPGRLVCIFPRKSNLGLRSIIVRYTQRKGLMKITMFPGLRHITLDSMKHFTSSRDTEIMRQRNRIDESGNLHFRR